MSIAIRHRVAEIMDAPGLDRQQHLAALRGLARLNRLSMTGRCLLEPIAALARRMNVDRLSVLDVAAGGGDNALALWRRAQRCGLQLQIHGVDISPVALQLAREQAVASGAPLEFSAIDVLDSELPRGYDVVMSSLFLHHLEEPQIVGVLRSMAVAANRMVVVSDLARCRRGLWLTLLATRLFTRSSVVRTDAIRSVRAALTEDEIGSLARQAGLTGARVSPRWPFRWLLTWNKETGV